MLEPGDLLTPDEARRLVPLPKSSFYEALKDGTIPALRYRRSYLIDRQDLERFVDGLRLTRPTDAPPDEDSPDDILRRIEENPV